MLRGVVGIKSILWILAILRGRMVSWGLLPMLCRYATSSWKEVTSVTIQCVLQS